VFFSALNGRFGKKGNAEVGDCEYLEGCLFFNDKMSIDSALGSMSKRNYSQGERSRCAGYMVAKKLGKWNVPGDLYPMMIEKAQEVMAEG
jgi:hypothetical protein